MAQSSTGVLIFEKRPFWGPELKRQFRDHSVTIRECRSLNDLDLASTEFSAFVPVLCLEAAPAECLHWLSQQFASDRSWHTVVIASPDLSDLEFPIREAGAIAFVSDEIAGNSLARLCQRWLRISLPLRTVSRELPP